jgi:predicted NBD/HSP70 family sugar kinase
MASFTNVHPLGGLAIHGAGMLPAVRVDDYNAEMRDRDGFIGDRASKGAFYSILDDWRERLDRVDADPLGKTPTKEVSKKELEKLLTSDDIEAAGLVHGVIEEFAKEFATVIGRFLRRKVWEGTERIVIGGGFRNGRVGELAIGRTAVILKSDGHAVDLVPIRHLPDEAGILGAAHLAPPWVFAGHDGIIGIDIGGTNIRAGVIQLPSKKKTELSDTRVWHSEIWRHRDESTTRDKALDRLGTMVSGLVARATKAGLKLAPFIGVGCPGIIEEDGSIERGAQNLPGNWESSRFNLADALRERVPNIGEHQTAIVIHNDAVVQGLSQLPFMQDVAHWGVLTIGTGLGNARFTNAAATKKKHAAR